MTLVQRGQRWVRANNDGLAFIINVASASLGLVWLSGADDTLSQWLSAFYVALQMVSIARSTRTW